MKLLYFILGGLFVMNITIWKLDQVQTESQVSLVKIQSLQSCYFTAVKFGGKSPEESGAFCEKHSAEITENFQDIAKQMDEITDKQFMPAWSLHLQKMTGLDK